MHPESVEISLSVGGSPSQEWVLVSVTGSSDLGSSERIREKMDKMQSSAIRDFEAGQQALHEARSQQALDRRVQSAEASTTNLRTQLEALQHELQQSLQTSRAEKLHLQNQLEDSQVAYHQAQQLLQQSVDEANTRTEDLQQRVQDAERRAEEAERRAHDVMQGAGEGEPPWVVQRDEINLTDTELGRGGWGAVRIAEFRGVKFAAKCLHGEIVSDYNQHRFIREINMAAQVRHPNLLQFIGATLVGELIILTELMPTSVRGELENKHIFSWNQISTISLDVARALNYLHLMQPSPIIHRDIGSANVLLEPQPSESWRAKVSDYGSVNLLRRLKTAAPGSPMYAAPEAQDPTLQSPKMDIFSFGVFLVELCTARLPHADDRENLIVSIERPGMVALIRQCLAVDKNARPSASHIITELTEQHN